MKKSVEQQQHHHQPPLPNTNKQFKDIWEKRRHIDYNNIVKLLYKKGQNDVVDRMTGS